MITRGTTKLRRLIEPLFEKTGEAQKNAQTVIDYFVKMVTATLLVERRVSISRLGQFELVTTNEHPPFKAGWRIIFTPSDCLKRQIKEHFMGTTTDKTERELPEREKLGVVTDENKEGVKTGAAADVCPECGSAVDRSGSSPKCPKCGTKPFEG